MIGNNTEGCECLRAALIQAYSEKVKLCTHFSEDTQTWLNDGVLVMNATNETHMTCAFSHLTSFSGFIGPPPSFNRMELGGVFSIVWMINNPASAIVALSTLALSIVTTFWSLKIYKQLVRAVSTAERMNDQYEYQASEFVRKRQMLEDEDVSYLTRIEIKLRTQWAIGALFGGYGGDPYLRTHRLLVLWGGVLIGMVLNVIFFRKSNPDCYSSCPDETYASGDPGCVQKCDEDCPGNGLLSSLLAAAISVPVSGSLNFLFAWLRRPFDSDLALKELAYSPDLSEEARSDGSPVAGASKPARCSPAALRQCCVASWMRKIHCMKVTFPYFFDSKENRARMKEQNIRRHKTSGGMLAAIGQKFTAGYTASARADVGRQRRELEVALDELWEEYDQEDNGTINAKELRKLMEDMNKPHAVSDAALQFVMNTADVSKTGVLNKGELRLAIPLYLSLQSEQSRFERAFDRYDVNNDGVLDVKEVASLLEELNDHVSPTTAEVAWVIQSADTSGDGRLDRADVYRAVAIWYPRLHKRRAAPPPPLTYEANPDRLKARVRMRSFEAWTQCLTSTTRPALGFSIGRTSSQCLQRSPEARCRMTQPCMQCLTWLTSARQSASTAPSLSRLWRCISRCATLARMQRSASTS